MAKEKSNTGQAKDGRARNWCAVVYPESAPENWREIIDAHHIQWAVSPLHDRDTDPTGEVKKAHWHVVFAFQRQKTFEQVKAFTDAINAPIPQRCADLRGSVRYFAHLDNPDKVQYNLRDVQCYGGFDLAVINRPTQGERHALMREIIAYIREEKITEFCDLLFYAMDQRPDDWFPLLCDGSTIMLTELIKSNWRRVASEQGKRLDYYDRLEADREATANREEIYSKRDENKEPD